MNNINEITEILNKLYNSNIIEEIITLNDKYKQTILICQELEKENKILQEKLKICNDQYSDLNKVSYVRSLSVELQNKNNYIKQLESQIDKNRSIKQPDSNSIEKELEKMRARQEEYKAYKFNIDDYEESNEFDLVKYKNIYYLKDVSSNRVFSILNNKPYLLVGVINNKGKVELV